MTIQDKAITLIEWYDAKFFPATCNEEDIRSYKMASFKSLGYLISRDDVTTKIAAEHNDQGEYRDVTLIPSGSVISIRVLTPSSLM